MKSLLTGIIVGVLLMGSVTFADNPHIEITSPVEDSTTGSDVVLTAVTHENAYCSYKLDTDEDHGTWTLMQTTGNKTHTQLLANLSNGEHEAHVHCCRNLNNGCQSDGMNEDVEWDVNTVSVPEYPSAIIPALLSVASFGLVSFRLK